MGFPTQSQVMSESSPRGRSVSAGLAAWRSHGKRGLPMSISCWGKRQKGLHTIWLPFQIPAGGGGVESGVGNDHSSPTTKWKPEQCRPLLRRPQATCQSWVEYLAGSEPGAEKGMVRADSKCGEKLSALLSSCLASLPGLFKWGINYIQ